MQKQIDETLQQLSDVLVEGCEYEGMKCSFFFNWDKRAFDFYPN